MSGHRPHRIFIFISTSAYTLEEREKRKRKNLHENVVLVGASHNKNIRTRLKECERIWLWVHSSSANKHHSIYHDLVNDVKKMKSEPKLSGTSSRGWKDTWKCLLDLIGVDGEYSIKRSDFFGRKKMKWLNTYKHMVYFSVFKSDPEGFAAIWTTECDWKERV